MGSWQEVGALRKGAGTLLWCAQLACVSVWYLGQALGGHGILAGKTIGTQAVMWSSKDLRSPGTGRQLVRVRRDDALKI